MSPEPKPDWARVKQLFGQAVELPPAARAGFLDAACASEAGLRQEVESLIVSHVAAEAASLFELPAASGLVAEPSWEGRRIGPYRVLAEIGRGGMGTVFRAVRDDDQYQKWVAIKLVKRDLDASLRRRFEGERQILAGLEHPGIAHLLDGGTTKDGLPYLVMDYVEGEPITDYAEKRKLSVAARLRLFREVCAAVHFAHQKLVVHRDIKPGNILVGAEGTPRLLDFGIARLVSPAAEFAPTLTLLRPMTPEYASPEQIQGQALTTATDVYSLGVLLCELLSGERPYRFSTGDPQEWLRVVVEVEPERPSALVSRRGDGRGALAHKLRGDLDNIVLMALRKEPERRYASADQLAEDVRRHQDGQPVIARPDTPGYRASKFLGRNRVAVAAGSACVIALLAAIAATASQARVARRERARAEQRIGDVRDLASAVLFEVSDAIEAVPDSAAARKLLVSRGLDYLNRLAREGGGETALRHDLVRGYLRLGDLQGHFTPASLGDDAGALASYRSALALAREALAADPRDVEARAGLAIAFDRLGTLTDAGAEHPRDARSR